mmetsp:Transcript_13615/g.24261  ORF Transcript_13615/g.24261 Transcript_13615/m.24261 type:complete len:604 (+) Transcript_13615:161-1972(+)|eukprot:CAMPEP_0184518068 /NCGR_PEP_ID=MMETSP0198_2-20121128/5891_1 /TAXON_ID=1112570 /ORGANISM="Thraustochytrium sp., Strain LLF1b" /LENGTH=603 /DNA_ID=CAMNT_0026908483 /DNA_START=107 /DNA_END=1918 /DNA_ORIENTATION=-
MSLNCFRKAPEGMEEAKGFVMVMASRGPPVIYGALFVAVAINEFARALSDCDGNVFGGSIKAESVLSILATIEGVVNALLGPVMGTFADLTPYRRTTLLLSMGLVIALIVVQGVLFIPQESSLGLVDPLAPEDNPDQLLLEPMFGSDASFLVLLAAVVIQVVAYEVVALLNITYATELSADKEKMTGFISKGYTASNSIQLFLAAVLTGAGIAFSLNSFTSGFAGGLISAAISSFFFIPGISLLGERRTINPDFKRGYCGLEHVVDVTSELFSKYSQARLMLLSWMFASAGVGSVTTLSTSYLQFHLGFQGFVVSALLALALVFSVPGAYLAKALVNKFSLRGVYFTILVLYTISFIVAPFLFVAESVPFENSDGSFNNLTRFGRCTNQTEDGNLEPETTQVTPDYMIFVAGFFTALWGLNLGVIYVMQNALYAHIIPGAKESSYFGVKVTFGKALTWAPPLIFTFFVENFDSIQFSISLLAPFFFVAAVLAYFIDEDAGKAEVAHTLHLRRGKAGEEFQVVSAGGRLSMASIPPLMVADFGSQASDLDEEAQIAAKAVDDSDDESDNDVEKAEEDNDNDNDNNDDDDDEQSEKAEEGDVQSK